MVKSKQEVSLKRKSGSALFEKRKFRGNILIRIHWEKTCNTYTQSSGDINSSTASSFAKSPVENFISSSAIEHKRTAEQE